MIILCNIIVFSKNEGIDKAVGCIVCQGYYVHVRRVHNVIFGLNSETVAT